MPAGNNNSFNIIISISACVVYLVTAINSNGYYHPDEHYQVIEFANFKLGHTSADELAWEYKAQIRSAIQPAVCYVVWKGLKSAGIQDPYLLTLVLRVITAVFALFTIQRFVRSASSLVSPRHQKIYIALSYFLWFIPFINVRFSSETWSGLFILHAIALMLSAAGKNFFYYSMLGVLMGLSFLFRFQTAFISAGMLLWMISIGREKPGNIFLVIISILLTIQAGVLIDTWFYGKYLYTFWNYFYFNIIEDVASSFGTAPWHEMLFYIVKYPAFPIGILIALAFLLLLIRKPKNLILWAIVPFLVIHTITPHKEERFLFPIVNMAPLLLMMGWQELHSLKLPGSNLPRSLGYAFLFLLISINLLGLVVNFSKSAGLGRMSISEYIHKEYAGKPVKLIAPQLSNPYRPWYRLPATFYKEASLTELRLFSLQDIDSTIISPDTVNLIVARKLYISESVEKRLHALNFKAIKQSIPPWIEWINKYYKGFDNGDITVLYVLADNEVDAEKDSMAF
jgi:GPI mannosyltransferase 3